MQSAVVIANPGGLPWMPVMAAGLARAGLLREYISPIAIRKGAAPPRLWRIAPRVLQSRIAKELRRRELPADVRAVHQTATLLEVLAIALHRLSPTESAHVWLETTRNITFDR